MKICHVTNFLPGYHKKIGGAERACYNAISLVKRFNKDNVILTSSFNSSSGEPNVHPVKTMEDYIGRAGTFLKLLIPFDPVAYFSSKRLLKKFKPDVVNLYNFQKLSLSVIAACKSLGIPTLFTIYDYWAFCPIQILSTPEMKSCEDFVHADCTHCLRHRKLGLVQSMFVPLRKGIFRKYLSKIDRFVVLSEASANIVRMYGVPKDIIEVIRLNQVNDEIGVPPVKSKDKKVFFAGWYEWSKGLHVLLKAIPKIINEVPNVHFYIFAMDSDPNYKQGMLDLVVGLGLEEKVSLLGKVPAPQFKDALISSNVVVIPEQWPNMSPVLVLEAMSKSKPIVASRLGGLPEFIKEGETGFLVGHKDSDGFAEKICEVLKDDQKMKKMGLAARRRFFDLFDEENILNKWRELYERYEK